MKNTPIAPTRQVAPLAAFVDLILFIGLMFFVRTIYFEGLGFWGNALFKSISTVGLATLLLYLRKQSWRDLGVTKPKHFGRLVMITGATLAGTVITMILFQMFIADSLPNGSGSVVESVVSNAETTFTSVITIMTFVWIESMLEELQDRGFSLNRFESLFSKIPFSTALAVLMQAAIFGFRHSYDLSERSITTGLIGLVFGIAYVISGRNLWPLIIAHIILNTVSMMDRF